MNIYNTLVKIWSLLNEEFRTKYIFLQLLIIVASILEVLSILGIGPFVSVLMGILELKDIPVFGQFLIERFPKYEIYAFGALVGFVIISSNLVFAYTLYRKAKFSYSLGAQTSNNIISTFLSNKNNINELSKDSLLSYATFETDRFSKGVINELMQINARIIISFSIITYLLYSYGISFLYVVLYLLSIYVVITLLIKEKLSKMGRKLTNENKNRLNNINDIYDNFLEVKSYNAENKFYNKQKYFNQNISESLAKIEMYSVLPRYLVEGVIFVSLILVMSYFYSLGDNIGLMIPQGAALVYGVMKLIPQISNIYQAFSNFSANINAVDAIFEHNTKKDISKSDNINKKDVKECIKIEIKDLYFSYEDTKVFEGFNYTFNNNKIYSIKGESGSGKSTLLALLFGTAEATKGKINFFDKNNNLIKTDIAFVPQKSFLVDGGIAENIAFAENKNQISYEKIDKILNNVNMKSIVDKLDNNDSKLKLSGGQIQRISIGRFLYYNYNIVLMDEPTSALDPKNEIILFELLNEIKKDKIIIIVSHSEVVDKYTDEIIRISS